MKLGLRHLIALLCVTGLVGAAAYHVHSARGVSADDVVVFAGLQGPATASTLPSGARADWRRFARAGQSRLALLLTDDKSPWLALAHGLETIGVPFTITDDAKAATQHDVVLIYPIVSGKVLDGDSLRALAGHARNGGTLIATDLAGGGLGPIFGIHEPAPSRAHTTINLDTSHPLTQAFASPDDRRLPFASTKPGHAPFGTSGYTLDGATALATFDDGIVAITERQLDGGGRAYALGLDPGFLLQRAYGRRLEGVAPMYANGYSPTVDVVLRLLKGMYQAGQKHAVTLGVVPDAKQLAAVFSHDIDFNRSIVNAVDYARHERDNGFAGTHFIQTKYIRDWNDSAFLDHDTRQHVETLAALDMEIASHSVSHSRVFSAFDIGSGDEQYPSYQPFVVSATETRDGTVLGELRVSRFLLESLAPGTRVSSFRPGHLEYPSTLPEALDAAGYPNSSSVTANVSLSHLPFRLTYARNGQTQVDVYEFPITIEDELPPAMLDRLDDAMVVARKIARHGGIYVVLIHPDVKAHKLEFQMQLVHRLKGISWFGSLAELGTWWRARAALEIDVADADDGFVINLNAPMPIKGLPLELPAGFLVAATQGINVIERRETLLLVDVLEGPASITLRRKP